MVDSSAAIRRGHPIVFTFLSFWSFVVAVIATTLTADFNNKGNSPSDETTGAVRFLVFVGWWTFLFSVAYLALFLTGVGGVMTSIAGHGIWIFLTWLFFLAGAGAITASINDDGDPYHSSRRALAGFSWIAWIQLTLMLALVGFIGGKAFRGGRGLKESLGD